MNLIDKFRLAAKGEPEKSFVQKGITNIDGTFTTDGWELFKMFLLEEHKDDFKTNVVDAIPNEETK